ncbi:hypothetical protein M011DRAFT_461360 [Sporormia fimetaria CBS 119925]|uniref:Uncharacterized protein n=1 Tax=Sporormia fimetaria CBS 119925 TaxID=1340428 RepID=A0A6A6V0E7_9PLEO|nr:hypothetical protein M011DRAFT_461360 [Sporormia fimetaria CBS 119925]
MHLKQIVALFPLVAVPIFVFSGDTSHDSDKTQKSASTLDEVTAPGFANVSSDCLSIGSNTQDPLPTVAVASTMGNGNFTELVTENGLMIFDNGRRGGDIWTNLLGPWMGSTGRCGGGQATVR